MRIRKRERTSPVKEKAGLVGWLGRARPADIQVVSCCCCCETQQKDRAVGPVRDADYIPSAAAVLHFSFLLLSCALFGDDIDIEKENGGQE